MKLPIEILAIIFEELLPQDLISCSRTCWIWNTMANLFLYKEVYICSESKYRLFVRSITPCQNHGGSCVSKPCERRQRLGKLVKAVDIDIYYSVFNIIFLDFPMTPLLELASTTPNVHAAKIYMPMLTGKACNDSFLNWRILATRWKKLTSLTLRNPAARSLVQRGLTNFSDILSRIQHLETTGWDGLGVMLPFLPAKPCLQSLIANVYDLKDHEALKEISQTCRNTLHTLIMNQAYSCIDLDDINISSNLLKTVGIHGYPNDELHITNFGDNLQHLEYRSRSSNRDRLIIQAMKKTSKLKSLSLLLIHETLEGIPLVLENNKNTLRTFYIYIRDWVSGSVPDSIIPCLLANNTRLCNVTTLFVGCGTLKTSDVQSLAEIFPNVEFLRLTRSSEKNVSMHPRFAFRGEPSQKWMTTDDLSHFRHLKAIDESTYAEVIDQNEVTYQKCIIRWDRFWEPPCKKTTVFP